MRVEAKQNIEYGRQLSTLEDEIELLCRRQEEWKNDRIAFLTELTERDEKTHEQKIKIDTLTN